MHKDNDYNLSILNDFFFKRMKTSLENQTELIKMIIKKMEIKAELNENEVCVNWILKKTKIINKTWSIKYILIIDKQSFKKQY